MLGGGEAEAALLAGALGNIKQRIAELDKLAYGDDRAQDTASGFKTVRSPQPPWYQSKDVSCLSAEDRARFGLPAGPVSPVPRQQQRIGESRMYNQYLPPGELQAAVDAVAERARLVVIGDFDQRAPGSTVQADETAYGVEVSYEEPRQGEDESLPPELVPWGARGTPMARSLMNRGGATGLVPRARDRSGDDRGIRGHEASYASFLKSRGMGGGADHNTSLADENRRRQRLGLRPALDSCDVSSRRAGAGADAETPPPLVYRPGAEPPVSEALARARERGTARACTYTFSSDLMHPEYTAETFARQARGINVDAEQYLREQRRGKDEMGQTLAQLQAVGAPTTYVAPLQETERQLRLLRENC